MLTLYGIANCDTVKKARAWLAAAGIEHRFHDYRKAGVPDDALARWFAAFGWEALLNRQGSTWRKLEPQRQAAVVDAESAAALMREQPSVIRRPVAEAGATLLVGFDPQRYASLR